MNYLTDELHRLENVEKRNVCGGFGNFFRMNPNLRLYLLDKVKAAIQKDDTDMRLAIPSY